MKNAKEDNRSPGSVAGIEYTRRIAQQQAERKQTAHDAEAELRKK